MVELFDVCGNVPESVVSLIGSKTRGKHFLAVTLPKLAIW